MSDTPPIWEFVNEERSACLTPIATTHRLKVPGGWVYRTLTPNSVALVFVPFDPKSDPWPVEI